MRRIIVCALTACNLLFIAASCTTASVKQDFPAKAMADFLAEPRCASLGIKPEESASYRRLYLQEAEEAMGKKEYEEAQGSFLTALTIDIRSEAALTGYWKAMTAASGRSPAQESAGDRGRVELTLVRAIDAYHAGDFHQSGILADLVLHQRLEGDPQYLSDAAEIRSEAGCREWDADKAKRAK